jgi:hypothetical protein
MDVSIQETTIVPAGDGYRVQLYVSDKPPADEASASLVLTLRLQIDRTGTATLAGTQLRALEKTWDALRPVMSALHPRG